VTALHAARQAHLEGLQHSLHQGISLNLQRHQQEVDRRHDMTRHAGLQLHSIRANHTVFVASANFSSVRSHTYLKVAPEVINHYSHAIAM